MTRPKKHKNEDFGVSNANPVLKGQFPLVWDHHGYTSRKYHLNTLQHVGLFPQRNMGCLHLGGHKKEKHVDMNATQSCSLNSRVLFCSRNFIPTCQNMSHTRRCINSWAACMWMNTSSVDQLRLCPANVGENDKNMRAKSWMVIPPWQWSELAVQALDII